MGKRDAKGCSIIYSIPHSSGTADAHPATHPVWLICKMVSAHTWTVRWSNLIEMVCAHSGVRILFLQFAAWPQQVMQLFWAWFPHLLKGLAAVPTFEEPGWLSKTVSEVHEIRSLDLWEVSTSGHFGRQKKTSSLQELVRTTD